jgi:hypothetical protein
MGIDKNRVGYWRKVVVRAKDSKDRRDPGGIVADCWRKDVNEMFSSTSRKESRISAEEELIFFMPKFPPVLRS